MAVITERLAQPTTQVRAWWANASTTVVGQATIFWVVARGILLLFTVIAVLFSQDATPKASFTLYDLLHHWDQWDADWYFSIARSGYYTVEATVYFPLYPTLIHLGSLIFGANAAFLVALVISQLGSLAAYIGIALLAAHERGDTAAALPALRVFAAYPLAFFLAAPYTEGLFLGLAVWALYATRRGWWYGAAACGALAMLTRSMGVALWLPMLWEFGRQEGWWAWLGQRWRARTHLRTDLWEALSAFYLTRAFWAKTGQFLAMALAVPSGLGLYSLYCYVLYHDGLSYLHQESAWFHVTMPPWQALTMVGTNFGSIPGGSFDQARFMVDLLPLVFCIGVTVALARRWPLAYTLYMVVILWLCLAAPTINGTFPFPLMSVGRYVLAAIPVYLTVSTWTTRHAWVEQLVINGGFMLQALLLAFYLRGGWIV
ncbi:MAG: hypothetical protein H0X24_19490 [Ktedonobacterales bacterium]|nr:hypothetical protein [Ktedonobacterales bacterium]